MTTKGSTASITNFYTKGREMGEEEGVIFLFFLSPLLK